MSLKLISALLDLDIIGPEREVLWVLCFYADDDGTNCYPGMALLKWKLGKSESQTQRLLKRLEAQSIIQIVTRGNGRGAQSEFILDLSKINLKENCPSKKGSIWEIKGSIQHQKDTIQHVKGSIQDDERVASSTGTGIADSKEFLLPKKKDQKEYRLVDHDDLLAELCRVTGSDWNIISDTNKGVLNEACKSFRKINTTVEHFKKFRAYWYAVDWRGRKGNAPTLPQVRETWGAAMGWTEPAKPKTNNGVTIPEGWFMYEGELCRKSNA